MADRIQRTGVLVVDDSEDFLAVACSWIESQPSLSLVGTARNGAEAQEAVARVAPDLVIMDAFMPVMDGFAATRAIKTRRAAPWVVMVSVHEGSTMEHEAWAAGADAFVVKANLADKMPAAIQSLRRGNAAARPASVPPTGRRPEDAPIEQRAVDSGSMSEKVVRLVRDMFSLDSGAQAPHSTRPRSRSELPRPVRPSREVRSMKQSILKGLGVASLALALTATATLAGGKTTFTPLGVPYAQPWDMSDDGSKLVGSIGYGEYFYWTRAEGVVPIGGGGQAGRVVVSGDGNVIAGSVFDENGIGVAGRWLGGTDWQTYEGIPGAVPCGTDLASAWGIDYYGQTLVGLGWLPQECRAHGAMWDMQNGGPATDLGSIVPGSASRANGISGDGRVIVGWQDSEFGERWGARWVDGVEEYVMTPDGLHVGEVETTNYDGTTMVGSSYGYNGTRYAWVWTARKGYKVIDSGPVYSYNVATSTSSDGSVVGGVARELQTGRARGWIYKNNTLIWLTDYVNDKKKIAPGWLILSISSISNDGSVISGIGQSPDGNIEGFVIDNF